MLEPHPLIGSVLGHYRLLEALGAGGMGVVFRAHDEQLQRDVAIKLLPVATSDDPAARARLLREARTASQLNHPHICTVFDVGEAVPTSGTTSPVPGPPVAYLAMELVHGETLHARLARGPLRPDEIVRLGRQLADALAHAHAHGVIHRDLKSANIVLTPEGRAKVLDFGLAKRVTHDVGAETMTGAPTVAQPGMIAGTLAYMAPEQLRGQPADARSDVWALGVVLHEMATGALPFPGETGYEVSAAILHQPPVTLPGTVPGALRAVIARCLEKDPAQRYADGGAAQGALDALATGQLAAQLEQAAPSTGPRTAPDRGRAHRLVGLGALAILVVGSALIALDVGGVRSRLVSRGGASAPARAIKLAVLPFANLTGDPEQEYLSDGVTQEMIAQLGRLHPQSLSVIARTSVMRYKKGDTPIDQIGRELGVEYVLEGSARREGGRIRISAELIHVHDQTQLWADTYERELSGILALQSEVAQKVANALALKLLPAEQARLANVRSVVPEAYEAYLKATHHRQSLTRSGFEAAERYYTLALEKDPAYAAAWAGLARVWTGRQQMAITPSRDAFRQAKAAALKALELDATEWEAHRALAGILTWGDWDWPAAEQKWKEILELNPNNPEALQGYSHFLMHMRRPDEAMAQIERALKLDPFSVRNQSFYATDLVYVRRYDDAIAAARAARRLQPDAPVARGALYEALIMKGLRDEALALDKEMFAGDRELTEALERGDAEAGYAGAQRRLAEILTARADKPGGVTANTLARRWLYAGDEDRALEWLERAYEDGDGNMPYIGMPIYDPLRADLRFQDLLRRMKLPQ